MFHHHHIHTHAPSIRGEMDFQIIQSIGDPIQSMDFGWIGSSEIWIGLDGFLVLEKLWIGLVWILDPNGSMVWGMDWMVWIFSEKFSIDFKLNKFSRL